MLACQLSGRREPCTGGCHLAALSNWKGQTPQPHSLHTTAWHEIWEKTQSSYAETDWGTEILKIIEEYYEQLYANKLNNLPKNGQVSRNIQPAKMSQEETDNLNRPITGSGIDSVIKRKNSQQTKVQDQTASLGNSVKYTKNLHLSSSNYSKKLKRKEHSEIHSMRSPSPWYLNQTKILQKRKLQASILNEYICKNRQQNISKPNPTIQKKDHTPLSSWIHSRVTRMIQHTQINQCGPPH